MPATLRQVAEAAGVSIPTASRVLSGRAAEGRIPEATAERVRAAAAKLGYRPNVLARSLRTRRTRTLGLVVTELANPFYATIAGAVEAAASASGYTLIIAASGEDPARALEYLRELPSRPADGLIVAPAPGSEVEAALIELAGAGFPLVTVDRLLPGLDCDRVVTDSRGAAAGLVAALTAMGCRRLAMAGGPDGVWTARERSAGFREGLDRAGLPFSEHLFRSGEFSVEQGRAAAEVFLASPQPPDGIVAANNRILAGVLETLAARGESARNVAVAGFDGVPYAPFLGRPIAVAEQPEAEIGRAAAGMLIERVEGCKDAPREVVLPLAVRTFPPEPAGTEGGGS